VNLAGTSRSLGAAVGASVRAKGEGNLTVKEGPGCVRGEERMTSKETKEKKTEDIELSINEDNGKISKTQDTLLPQRLLDVNKTARKKIGQRKQSRQVCSPI